MCGWPPDTRTCARALIDQNPILNRPPSISSSILRHVIYLGLVMVIRGGRVAVSLSIASSPSHRHRGRSCAGTRGCAVRTPPRSRVFPSCATPCVHTQSRFRETDSRSHRSQGQSRGAIFPRDVTVLSFLPGHGRPLEFSQTRTDGQASELWCWAIATAAFDKCSTALLPTYDVTWRSESCDDCCGMFVWASTKSRPIAVLAIWSRVTVFADQPWFGSRAIK